MNNTDETVADLRATCDYITDITERSDTLEFDDGVTIQDELRAVKAKADEAIRLIDQQILIRLEAGGPRLFGGRVFARVKRYVERHDHELVTRVAIDQGLEKATDRETGDINPKIAAEFAARAMATFFLSPSDKAKVTPLKKLGVTRQEFERKEFKAWDVSVTKVEEED